MKKHLTILIVCIAILNSCTNKTSHLTYQSITGFTQGTHYNITYATPDSMEIQERVEQVLRDFDNALSTYNPESIISQTNRNEQVGLKGFFTTCFERAIEISAETDGAFDITAAPVINAWGFGSEDPIDVSDEIIDSLLQFCGYEKISIIVGMILKEDPRIQLNVNGIAQGYAVDVVGDNLEELGIENYLVEIGGEMKTKGLNSKGKEWRVGIDKPIDNNMIPGANLQAIIKMTDKAMATSGNYRKFYEKDGVKYSHTIDPKTGYPVDHSLLSATVIADDCMTADAYATAFMVMGLEKSKEFLETHPELLVYLIYSGENGEFMVYHSPSLKKKLKKV